MPNHKCDLCGVVFAYTPDSEYDVCECGAQYSFNEGYMLSASWAVGEIKRLRARQRDWETERRDMVEDRMCAVRENRELYAENTSLRKNLTSNAAAYRKRTDQWIAETKDIERLRAFVKADYTSYEEHHPYARELLGRFPWLAEAAEAKEKSDD